MAIEDDIVVIGGGLAGATAATVAARHGGRVRLLSRAESTLRQASGLIDVLGYTPACDGPVADPFAALGDLPAAHPYRLVGEAGIRAGLDVLEDLTDRYAGAHTDRNALVPTVAGRVKPTARYPVGTASGLASDDRSTLLVGVESIGDFDAPLAAAYLDAADVPFDVRGETIRFPLDRRADASIVHYARSLDRDEDGVREALATAIAARIDGERRVGVPAVLGVDEHDAVRRTIERAVDADVFEVPMGPPSLPGIRLDRDVDAALRDAGVRVASGDPVVDFEADDDRVHSVIVDRDGARIPYRANEFVLATGGLVGQGITAGRDAVREPIFGCRVDHPADRYEWAGEGAFDEHPFARFGVTVDTAMRPLTEADRPAFENLRAAGAVLAGADFAAEKSGSGVSLATGYVAGERAGEAA